MARPLRIELADGVYHVVARGNERKLIYRDEADRETFLATLDQTRSRFGWLILCYCLMGNHYHLLVRTARPNLARGMCHLNGVYAKRFNRRHGRVGHLFQARYHAILVQQDEHLVATVRYIVNNPVRAHIVASCEDWRWSSHRATLGKQPPGLLALDALLQHFDEHDRSRARQRYRELIGQSADPPTPHGVVLGSEQFVSAVTRAIELRSEIPRQHIRPVRPTLEQIFEHRRQSEAIAAAYRQYDYTLREIAGHLGCHYATISRRLRAHEQRTHSGDVLQRKTWHR